MCPAQLLGNVMNIQAYESNIDWINEDDEIRWHTRNREYLYIDGAKYEYSCDGSTLEIKMKGKTKRYYKK